MQRYAILTAAAVTASTALLCSDAAAHVAPSRDDNNRYLKLTPLGDRVRFAYTVYFGDVPGARARRTMDTDHDGAVSDPEAASFGHRVAADVRGAIDVTVDGKPVPFAWSAVDVGLGMPTVAAGSFSVDLVAWICLPKARGTHSLRIRDRFALPNPGETELRVEDSVGVHLDREHLGDDSVTGEAVTFRGAGGPLTDEGWSIEFTAGPESPVMTDGRCSGDDGSVATTTAHRWWLIGVGGAIVVVAFAGFAFAGRRRPPKRETR